MAISRFTSRFKTRTDIMDNITPNNVVQANVSVPHGEWKPASWLPVVWQNEKSKDYFVISSGKVVSFDASGRVVPSGLLRRCLDATAVTDAIIDYDANDKAARVIDITTGEFYAGAGTTGITLRAFIKAASENGWLPGESLPAEGNNAGELATELAALKVLAKKFISAPVGICAYDVYAWAGDDPANLHFTNYQKQHLIQFFTDIQMKAPQIAKVHADEDTKAELTLINNATLKAMPRYKGIPLSSNAVGLKLTLQVAAHTSRTPFTVTMANGVTPRYRSEPSLVAKEGDWFLDDEAAILIMWDDDDDKPDNLVSVDYFHYDGAASADLTSTQEKFIHFVGDCKPGDFVTFDKLSNMVVRSASLSLVDVDAQDDTTANESAILDMLQEREDFTIGRVMDIIKEPRGLLERVRTGFQGDEFDASAKMPGSATGGFSDMITLSEQIVADQIVVVNVKI